MVTDWVWIKKWRFEELLTGKLRAFTLAPPICEIPPMFLSLSLSQLLFVCFILSLRDTLSVLFNYYLSQKEVRSVCFVHCLILKSRRGLTHSRASTNTYWMTEEEEPAYVPFRNCFLKNTQVLIVSTYITNVNVLAANVFNSFHLKPQKPGGSWWAHQDNNCATSLGQQKVFEIWSKTRNSRPSLRVLRITNGWQTRAKFLRVCLFPPHPLLYLLLAPGAII